VLASSAADHGFQPWSGQAKDYKIGICCFSAKHATIRSMSKDWLAGNPENVVSEWSDMSIRSLLFQWASTCFGHDVDEKIPHINSNHSLCHFWIIVFICTVKPVYKGHSREPGNVAFMSSCPLYTGKNYM
jgi:hypothetical protein